jgi:CDP-glycerol glycerophosphotransferase (TagB/SpsB family)
MHRIKYIFVIIKQILFWLCSVIVPKKQNLWVFGAWQGKVYGDNAKSLFEYMNKEHPEVECVWLTHNPDVLELLKKKSYKAAEIHSLKGYLYLLRAKIAVQTEGNADIGGFVLHGTKVIQLWHGVAPKKANWNDRRNTLQKLYFKLFVNDHSTSYWMVSSERNKGTMMDLFGARADRSFVTGYPRNDTFVQELDNPGVLEALEAKYPNSKKIIYMPTHRNFGTKAPFITCESLMEVDKKLKEENIVMVFKPHFHELKHYANVEGQLTNIIFAKDAVYSDVYSYIGGFDLLISDYSSIIYDFLCAKKPIVLFPYDLEEFKDTDAGLFDYFFDVPAGPFCYTWDEVVASVTELLKEDTWSEKREVCRQMFHPFDDGKNSERVYHAVKKLLKKN